VLTKQEMFALTLFLTLNSIRMKFFFILFVASFILFACNNDSKQTSTEISTGDSPKSEPEMKIQIPNMSCYTYVSGKDTIKLKLEKFPNVVTGMLAYLFNEKDKSRELLMA
jgi:hypothetical protein